MFVIPNSLYIEARLV